MLTCVDKQESDDALLVVFFSDQRFDHLKKVSKSTIRGVIHVGGWYLKPVSPHET